MHGGIGKSEPKHTIHMINNSSKYCWLKLESGMKFVTELRAFSIRDAKFETLPYHISKNFILYSFTFSTHGTLTWIIQ